MEFSLIYPLIGLGALAGCLGLFLYLGHRSSRRDLISPPEFGQRHFGRREYGKRPPVRPAPRPEPKAVAPKPPAAPDPLPEPEPAQSPAELVAAVSAPAPMIVPDALPEADPTAVWRREGPAGTARLSEACYTADQYAEREVKALLLQNRYDRAIRHVRGALKLPAAEAEAYVARLAHQLRL
ncbi:hypothetical protein [Parasphingopyxis sp.]|uniref:hypothetical protein n=1 Tax=Parasphingopyxis sp. TaxID=1920299 RepID=UPI00261FE9A9|nr:hypothetical protein [Parasphingopyxis sp.]